MSTAPLPPTPLTPSLADGDAAAREGRWTDAVSIWSGLRGGAGGRDAEQRLRWFLDQSGSLPEPESHRGSHDWSLILGAAGLGFLGTAIVLLGERLTGTAAVVTSIAAWACYLATGALIVAYALSRHRAETTTVRLHDSDVTLALDIARSLDDGPREGRS